MPDALAHSQRQAERKRRNQKGQQRELPVGDKNRNEQKNERNDFPEQFRQNDGNRLLNLFDIAAHFRHEPPGRVHGKKTHRLAQDMVEELVSQIGHNVLADAAHGIIGIINADSLENGQKEQRQAELRNQLPGHEGEDEGNILLNKCPLSTSRRHRALPCHQNIIE